MDNKELIASLLKDPAALRGLLEESDVRKVARQLDREERNTKTSPRPGIVVKERFTKEKQFTGVVITVTSRRINGGAKTFSIRANGRSPKDTHEEAQREIDRLTKRYNLN